MEFNILSCLKARIGLDWDMMANGCEIEIEFLLYV